MRFIFITLLLTLCFSCRQSKNPNNDNHQAELNTPFIVVLGTAQDAGAPQIACSRSCCLDSHDQRDKRKKVVSLGLVDPQNETKYLFEATPNITEQVDLLNKSCNSDPESLPDGIFLTHAHIGHYTGLMYLGKEAINADKLPVYAMPKMRSFLSNNGPWNNLVTNQNISLQKLSNDSTVQLSSNLEIVPHLIPHRDEYSETVGYTIIGPNKKALFIPDIDKWSKWNKLIVEEIKKVDYAFIDATFYDGNEINTRDISEIPHPFVKESMKQFKNLTSPEKGKIIFIHFNHTNPMLDPSSIETKQVLEQGFKIARTNTFFSL